MIIIYDYLFMSNLHVRFLYLYYLFFIDLLSRIDLDELMKKDEPPLNFPKTLDGFEYAFNECKSFILFLL